MVDATPLDQPNLVAVGSILHWADEHSIVWGSGLLSATTKPKAQPAALAAVRGPLTRERLAQMGMAVDPVIGDPGILISDYFARGGAPARGIGIVPHYVDLEHPYVVEVREQGANLINPLSPLPAYLEALSGCEAIVSSSLHGIVFAHSYGIPASWVTLSSRVLGNGFKFRDYYGSIGYGPDEMPALTADDSWSRVVDSATLPRREIDREAMRAALMTHAPVLTGAD